MEAERAELKRREAKRLKSRIVGVALDDAIKKEMAREAIQISQMSQMLEMGKDQQRPEVGEGLVMTQMEGTPVKIAKPAGLEKSETKLMTQSKDQLL